MDLHPGSMGEEGEGDAQEGKNVEPIPRALCSILNVVVDFMMVPPTPLEPVEYSMLQGGDPMKAKQETPQVPVLRIFGPIVRRDVNNPSGEPSQSACLHVHGAFPYMLARPVLAGPDGSLHRSSHRQDGMTPAGHVDWDDPDAIERILPVLLDNLEDNVQASFANFGGASKPAAPQRVIRRLSVVTGRGFYTFCPGPVAPFLRVEYYNPSLRWKVKRCLERGLDLPSLYHPDPFQYQATLKSTPEDADAPTEALQFHCYEAHIPYTMQVFKDWNLAGMSYIHVSKPKFRWPLPTRLRDAHGHTDVAFLSSNTAIENMWYTPVKHDVGLSSSTPIRSPSSSQSPSKRSSSIEQASPLIPFSSQKSNNGDSVTEEGDNTNCTMWILSPTAKQVTSALPSIALTELAFYAKKETSCDVELDIVVDDILNVHGVMKEAPEDPLQCHWRAVPSLREIWKEERIRMAKLLPPAEDFLSQRPDFTLAVKKDAELPGAELARRGIEQLVDVTPGLKSDFRRALREIIRRHSDDIIKVDRVLQNRVEKRENALTPTDDETLEALGAIGQLFSESPSRKSDVLMQKMDAMLSQESQRSFNSGSQGRFQAMSQSYYDGTIAANQNDDEFELTQRMERGDSIVDGPFEHVDDFIDPETLVPFDDLDEDEDDTFLDGDSDLLQESRMETELSTLTTQTLNLAHPHANTTDDQLAFHFLDEDESVDSLELLLGDEAGCDRKESFDLLDSSFSLEREKIDLVSSGIETSRLNEVGCHIVLPWKHAGNTTVGLKRMPPSRRKVLENSVLTSLLPMVWRAVAPSWAKFNHEFSMQRHEQPSTNDEWFPAVQAKSGVEVELTFAAPTRRSVSSWSRGTLKREHKIERHSFASKRQKVEQTLSAEARVSVEHDGNSRTIGVTGIRDEEVEEVEWKSSQLEQLSLSQVTTQVPDFEKDVDVNSENDRTAGHETPLEGSGPTTLSSESDGARYPDGLEGIGNQGGRIWVECGGHLKAKTRPTQTTKIDAPSVQPRTANQSNYLAAPITAMAIEVHVQCRTGRAGINDSKTIAMTPDPERDRISAVVYILGRDPGGGEAMEIVGRGCIVVPIERELARLSNDEVQSSLSLLASALHRSMPRRTMGILSPLSVEVVKDERQLLLRLASVVRWKDPDMLISWDTQGGGLGYIIERGAHLGTNTNGDSSDLSREIDMARLLGRTPTSSVENKGVQADNSFFNDSEVASDMVDSPVRKPEGGSKSNSWRGSGLGAEWDERVGAGAAAASITGRLVYAAWKIIAEEVKHPNASYLQAVVQAVLNRRIPFHDNMKLNEWFGHDSGRERWRVLNYRLTQAMASLQLFDALDIVGRAGEAARLSGVEFSQSFPGIRGSQYKVEGVLLRALQSLQSDERGSKMGRRKLTNGTTASSLSGDSKSQTQSPWKARRGVHEHFESETGFSLDLSQRCYYFYSPSLHDTNQQEALEVQALTLEPQSGHIVDPVVVCDFTALYPSLIIAYNLCYSTCSGRLEYHSTRQEMLQAGRTTNKLGPFLYSESRTATVLQHHMKSIVNGGISRDRMYIAPTGTMYVSESVLKGVLPQVLDEILSTRAMLKKASKQYRRHVQDLSPSILRQLEARQLALKYVANVTYGYTSATFSGRCAMPLLADTIVECARRTLTRAINMANEWGRTSKGKWFGCEVLYGDTDSVFIRLPGRSVKEAFQFGEEFCKSVTASNPPPVQLKLEKVYLGCILQTKKKYCGMKYEARDQRKPTFEAKGLETVRRDQCALTQKILRNSLVTLFKDGIRAVKAYLFRQWSMILAGRLPLSDFILTGRVRSRYRGGKIGPVQAVLARRLAEADPGKIIRHKERLPYVIVATPGVTFRLRDCVLTPMELMEQWDAYTIHAAYYITKHVNASLQRCFGLAPHFADIKSWYEECPKPRRRIHFWPTTRSGNSVMISSYFGSDSCALCGSKCRAQGLTKASVCVICREDPGKAMEIATMKLNFIQNEAQKLAEKCRNCNLCFQDSSTFGVIRPSKKTGKVSLWAADVSCGGGIVTPLANCSCIDCPITFDRHRVREHQLEAEAIYQALDAS